MILDFKGELAVYSHETIYHRSVLRILKIQEEGLFDALMGCSCFFVSRAAILKGRGLFLKVEAVENTRALDLRPNQGGRVLTQEGDLKFSDIPKGTSRWISLGINFRSLFTRDSDGSQIEDLNTLDGDLATGLAAYTEKIFPGTVLWDQCEVFELIVDGLTEKIKDKSWKVTRMRIGTQSELMAMGPKGRKILRGNCGLVDVVEAFCETRSKEVVKSFKKLFLKTLLI